MFKKVLSYVVIVSGLIVLGASTSSSFRSYITNLRDNDKWWGVTQNNHGDLASMSGLYFLKKFHVRYKPDLKRAPSTGPKNNFLLIHGDSYLWKINKGDSVFANLSSFQYVGWHDHYNYHLDPSKRNVFVLEVSERLLREYFFTTDILKEVQDTAYQPQRQLDKALSGAVLTAPQTRYGSIFSVAEGGSIFFNKHINQNLQCNLFNYNFMYPLFGSKAALNYYLFTRTSGDVIISKDKDYLFFKPTITADGIGSSYSPVTDANIDTLVSNLNRIYSYYKATGFKEVYLTVVPNTVTIMQPEGYNNLIPLVQNDPRLKMGVIDVYSIFSHDAEKKYFFHGDTHWNNSGKQLWIDMVNDVLEGRENKYIKPDRF